MNNFGIRMAVAAVACSALSLSACWAEEPKKSDTGSKETAPVAEPAKSAEAAAPAAQVAANDAPAPAAAPAAPAAAAPAASEDNAAIEAKAKELGVEFKDGRFRDKDGHPTPVVTKDYKVDWGTWQGFRRYHDACHVCHGPNALGSSFAPSLAESLKTMDYETFYGTVVGGKIREEAGTKYVMPAFGEDKNIMCYLDDIYTYIKARSTDAMPAGRPAGRHDISPEASKAASECTGS
ncbi:MAG: c-type cytochrome, methanol metabolism-related [Hyphomicrobium sp.]